MLSQRTRDEKTIKATKALFDKFGTAQEIAGAEEDEIRELIEPAGFYNVKAKRIKKIANKILNEYNSSVPKEINKLLKLPGVGRKTANCVIAYGFKEPAIPVDTHVNRTSNRIGLVDTEKPEETEKALTDKIPRKMWGEINRLMVKFGQDICRPISPHCDSCFLKEYCDYYEKNYG